MLQPVMEYVWSSGDCVRSRADCRQAGFAHFFGWRAGKGFPSVDQDPSRGFRDGRGKTVLFSIFEGKGFFFACVVVLYGLVAGAGLVMGGHIGSFMDRFPHVRTLANPAQSFSIRNIDIVGDFPSGSESRRDVIMWALGVVPGDMITAVDVEAARARILELPWVGGVSVRKLFPDTLRVWVQERHPFAIWQHDGRLVLTDRTGHVIGDEVGRDHLSLPFFVGEGANLHAEQLLSELESRPEIRDQVKAMVRVADRRWNLRFKNGLEIKLPEENAGSALDTVARIHALHPLSSSGLVSIDLRLPDRIALRLSPDVAAVWRSQFEDRIRRDSYRGRKHDT